MSKSRDILADGEATRATFTPEAGSAPARAYQYWVEQRRDGIYPSNENFCHFWRVVVIWSPLARLTNLFNPLLRLIGKIKISDAFAGVVLIGITLFSAAVMLALLAWLVITYPLEALTVLGVMLGAVGIVSLIVWIVGLGEERRKEKRAAKKKIEDQKWNDDWDAFYNGIGPDPMAKYRSGYKKEPGKIAKFFKAVAEYCLIAVNIVRVNKWKICPKVEVPRS